MAPLGDYLVGYLSMFLQLGVLVLLTGLAALVRASLGRRPFDGWTAGLAANAAAIAVMAVGVFGRDILRLPHLPATTIVYAALEDAAALAFIVAIRRERGVRGLPPVLLAVCVLALGGTACAAFGSPVFLDAYRVHSASFAALLAFGAFESLRRARPGIGSRLVAFALTALSADYLHVPLLTLLGVPFPADYLGLESYVTIVLDIVLGVGLVVHATDGAHAELERRNDALARAQRALQDAAFTDALCGIPNRAAFLERIAAPPSDGAVAMIDLDGLKAINDGLGHSAGDAALATVARCLRDRCGDAGLVYRIGGDEFAAIWDGVSEEIARALLSRAERDLAVLAEDAPRPVAISWGVATFARAEAFGDALIAADTDLYARRARRRLRTAPR